MLGLALFAGLGSTQVFAAQGTNWPKMGFRLISTGGLLYFLNDSIKHNGKNQDRKKIDRYHYGLEKSWRLAGVGAFVAALASDSKNDFYHNMGGAAHATALLSSSYLIAGNKKIVNALRKIPVVNYIFTDPVDEEGDEQTSVSAAARYMFTLLVLDGVAKKASNRFFNFNLNPYSLLTWLTVTRAQ